ncbi:Uncharacterised protein [uncultured archaeon]|nr:Uncharacterised protein [uncultured archaeon]
MNDVIKYGLILLIAIILMGIPEMIKMPSYATALKIVYGSGSCGTCHINSAGGGPLTPYGIKFAHQPNFNTDPVMALKAIGAPPNLTPASRPVKDE